MALLPINLVIVTPDGEQLSERVVELTAPSVSGEFGVLEGHRPMLAALSAGIVSYRLEHRDPQLYRVAVGAGFVEVFADQVVLLTERFTPREGVDPARARAELQEADTDLQRLQDDPGGPEYREGLSRELWAAAQLELYGEAPPPRVRTAHEFQLAQDADDAGPEPAPEPDSEASAADRGPHSAA
jgi:F-type H+-transporting ATPase subunit epsilon